MSGVDVGALRAAAEAATPGPWTYDDTYMTIRGQAEEAVCAEDCGCGGGVGPTDGAFMAAASPDVVLALLDRVSELEAGVERVRGLVAQPETMSPNDVDWFDVVSVDDLNEALDGPGRPSSSDLPDFQASSGQLPHPGDDDRDNEENR